MVMKRIISQKELAEKLQTSPKNLSPILGGLRRPSLALALKLEKNSGVGRFTWLYGSRMEIRRELEKSIGMRINFGRGRIPKKKKQPK